MMKKIIKILIIMTLIIGFVAFSYPNIYGNFHQIDENAYRSGQLNKYNLPLYIKKYEIKTIINLRGESTRQWYEEETNIAKSFGVQHINIDMNSGDFYDYNTTSHILNIMKNAKKPILIHCLGGADRTSLVSAIYEYGINHKSKELSQKQLSWYYGHFPTFKKKAQMMDDSFEHFVKNESVKKLD